MTETFSRRSRVGVRAEDLWRWHTRPGAFERLTPPWDGTEVASRDGGIEDGARVVLRVPVGPVHATWIAEHRDVRPPRSFRDVQVSGPFARFEHEHRIDADGGDACFLEDRIEYALPLGALGRLLAGGPVARRLERAFAWRHETLRADAERHDAAKGVPAMRIVVTGASGLVGSSLVPFLTTGGHEVVRAVRGAAGTGEVRWDAETGIDPALLAGADAVVHLAGEGIAASRWNAAVKERIRTSRVAGTRAVAESVARASPRPRVLVVASAVGFYGDRGETPVDETSAAGEGFLPDVCRGWEAAADPARDAGARVVALRFGVVLSPAGGALRKMLLPFRLGIGGALGNGRQYLPWVSIDDAVGAVHHALVRPEVAGPVNVVAPQAVTNRQFTKALGSVLGRPTVLPMPAFAARLAFGEMADPLLLTGQRVVPERLRRSGFAWRHETIDVALRHVLGR